MRCLSCVCRFAGSPQPEASTSALPQHTSTSSGLPASASSSNLFTSDEPDPYFTADDDLGLSSDDEVDSVLPVYLSQTHGANLHLFQYPVTDKIEVPDAALERGGKIGARWKSGVRRFELDVSFLPLVFARGRSDYAYCPFNN